MFAIDNIARGGLHLRHATGVITRAVIVVLTLVPLQSKAQAQASATTAYPSYPAQPAPQIQAPGSIPDPLSQPVPVPQSESSTTRPTIPAELRPLGIEQKAWQKPQASMGPRQTMPGFLKVAWRPDVVMEVNVREGMLTVMKWPLQEEIVTREISDRKTFESRIGPDRRSILIHPTFSGVDGNMVVYGSSGNVYNVYLRSIPRSSDRLPDTTVEVVVGGMSDNYGGTLRSTAPTSAPYTDYRDLYQPAVTAKTDAYKAGSREWATAASAIGQDMEANIDILVPDQSDQIIAPVRAWHDKHFTYLDFGPNASSMNQWPVASLLTDGTETPVGTRTTGPNGSIMIIEAIGDIVLRNGRHLVCLKLRNQPDNRVSPRTLVADTTSKDLPRSRETIRIAPASPPPVAAQPAPQSSKAVASTAGGASSRKAPRAKNSTFSAAPEKKPEIQAPTAKATPKTAEKPIRKSPDPFVFDASALSGTIH